jgi:hypothetical protein
MKRETWRHVDSGAFIVQLDAGPEGFSDGRCSESVQSELKYLGAGRGGK